MVVTQTQHFGTSRSERRGRHAPGLSFIRLIRKGKIVRKKIAAVERLCQCKYSTKNAKSHEPLGTFADRHRGWGNPGVSLGTDQG